MNLLKRVNLAELSVDDRGEYEQMLQRAKTYAGIKAVVNAAFALFLVVICLIHTPDWPIYSAIAVTILDGLLLGPYLYFLPRYPVPATLVSTALTALAIAIIGYFSNTVAGATGMFYAILLSAAGLVLARRRHIYVAAAIIATVYLSLALLAISGALGPVISQSPSDLARSAGFVIVGIAALAWMLAAVLGRTFRANVQPQADESPLQRHINDLATLQRVGQTILGSLDLEETLTAIMQQVNDVFQVEASSVMLVEEGELRFKTAVGSAARKVRSYTLEIGQGVAGWVAQEGRSLVVPDITREPRHFSDIDRETGFVTKSLICVPLRAREEVIGVIEILNPLDGRSFTTDDLRLLESIAALAAIAIENARLYEMADQNLARRVGEMSLLAEVDHQVSASLDLEVTLNAILNAVRSLIDYSFAEICLWDDEKQKLFTRGRGGQPGYTALTGGVYGLDESYSGWLARHRKPLLLTDAEARSDVHPKLQRPEYPVRSYVGVPLQAGDEFIGTLELASDRKRAFDADDQRLLVALAERAAVAIQKARLYEEAQSRVREMSALLEAGLAVTSLELQETLDTIAKAVARAVGAEQCSVYLLDEERGELIPHAAWGLGEVEYGQMIFSLGEGTVGWIGQQGQPLFLDDPQGDPRFVPKSEVSLAVRNLLGVPLEVKGRIIGVIQVWNKVGAGRFDADDERLLAAFASQAAIAVENARLYQEMQRRLREMSTLVETSSAISSTLDVRQVLDTVARQMVRALDVTGCAISDWDKEEGRLVTVAAYREEDIGTSYAVRDYPATAQVLRTQQPLVVQVDDPEADAAKRADLEKWGRKTLLMLPLVVKGQTAGLVELYEERHKRHFTAEEIVLCETLASQAAVALENARLYEQAQRRVEEMTGLYEIAAIASSTLDMETLMGSVTAETVNLLHAEKSTLLLYDETSRELVAQPAASFGFTPEQIESFRLRVNGEAFAHSVFVSGRHFISNNARRDRRILAPYRPFVEKFGVNTLLSVPLLAKNRSIGELHVVNKKDGGFTEDDARLLCTIATHFASALENARLYGMTDERLRVQLKELTALQRISQELGATLELERILEVVMSEALRATGATHGNVMLLDPDTGRWHLQVAEGYTDEEVEAIRRRLARGALTDITLEALRTGQPQLVGDVGQDERFISIRPDIRSALSVPILFAETVVGIIGMRSTGTNVIDREDMGFVQALAAQAAIAIGNARAYKEQVRQRDAAHLRAERLSHLSDISRSARADRPLSEILEDVCYAIQETVGFRTVLLSVAEGDPPLLRRVASAGLPLAVFEELCQKQQPLANFQRLMRDEFRIGQSYFLPHQRRDEWKEGLDLYTPLAEEKKEWEEGQWHPYDMMLVPLRGTGGELQGILTVDDPMDGLVPSARTVEALELFANQAAIVIENARLFERAWAQAREVEALAETGRKLASTLELDAVLDSIMDACLELFQVQQACFIMMDKDGYLRMRRHRGLSEEFVRSIVGRPGEGFFGKVYQSGEPILVRDTRQQLDPASAEAVLREGITSFVHVPVKVKGETVAVMNLTSSQENRRFSEKDMERLSAFANQAAVAIENARLFESEQERRQYADTLREVAEVVNSTLNPDEVFELILDQLGKVVAYDSASIQLLEGNDMRIISGRGFANPEATIGLVFPVSGDTPNAEVLRTGKPFIVPDAPAVYSAFRDEPHTGIRSWLGVPVLYRAEIIGMITLDKHTPNFYTERDAQLALTFANQVATAIVNARLHADTVSKMQEITILYEVGRRLSMTMDLDDLLTDILKKLRELAGYFNCAILLVDETTNQLYVRAAQGYLEDTMDRRIQIGREGITGWVAEHKELLNVPDVSKDDRYIMTSPQVRSEMAVPMLFGDKVIGVLDAESDELDAFGERDKRILSAVAAQTAIAIENVRLLEETRRSAEEMQLLYALGVRVSAALDLDTVLENIVESAWRLMGTDFGVIYVVDQETGRWVQKAAAADSRRLERYPVHRPRRHGLTDTIIRTGQPVVIEDTEADERVSHNARLAGVRAMLGVPVSVEGQTTGVLWTNSMTPCRFAERDVALLSFLANQAAVSIRNAQLYERINRFSHELEQRVEERTRELALANEQLTLERDRVEALYRISRDLSTSLDLDHVLAQALALVNEAVGAPQGAIMLCDPESNHLIYRAALGRAEPLPRGGKKTRFKRGVGLAGWVLEHRQPVIVPDVSQDSRWLKDPSKKGRARSALAVPLTMGADVTGVLMLYHPQINYFTDVHLKLVTAAAAQVASAINNANLYGLIQESAQRLGATLMAQQTEAAKNRAVLEGITDGVVVIDTKGEVILFNPAAEQILGIRADRVVGCSIQDTYAVRDSEMLVRGFLLASREMAALRSGREFVEERIEVEGRVANVRIAPVMHGDEYLGVVAVFRDITKEVEADRIKSEFVSTVSHELRTPMTSIKGYTDLLCLGAAGALSDNQRRFLNVIKSNADRLALLVNDLLDISRLDTGRIRLDLEPVNVGYIIGEVFKSLHQQIEEKGLVVNENVPDDLPAVKGDHDRVTQILLNLVTNACKYTLDGGQITVTARPVDGMLQIDVTDTGIGIAEEERDKIFDRFYRADHPVVHDSGGTGLGLPIVKSFVELHGGNIWVTSEPGKGSTFSFTLPLVGDAEEKTKPDRTFVTQAWSAPPDMAKDILVVEDDHDIAELIRMHLQDSGYRVTTVTRGREALAAARQRHPDLITLDIRLPDIDGFELLQQLKLDTVTANIPVVILSIVQDPDSGFRLGAVDYLSKPVDKKQLLTSIEAILSPQDKVLVIDDDQDTVHLLEDTLGSSGFSVISARDGRQGLALAREAMPNLVLLDLKLPGLDGYEILTQLKRDEATRNIPVIIMTGSVTDEEVKREKVLALGATQFLTKPFVLGDLVGEIRRVLSNGSSYASERARVGSPN